MTRFVRFFVVLGLFIAPSSVSLAQQVKQPVIPHAQDKPPNEPRDPVTAAGMMTVPDGFSVEVVAAEPDIVNPVAMAIDERGRFWITESLEYPRREPGPGRDLVKILEDTDGDGRADKFTVFMEGLNIPSGIAVGHGGVWIANSPDILFVQDTDGDGKADKQEVVVTGFGRSDTHELPNSLTWGPDGWLYGLNGVFNHSHVKYAKSNPNYSEQHPGWPLTCAMYRIHPRTREFQVFCEGTSNPWGIAFNDEGEAFVSACVIDHLWHLVESGYYHRQGGPYPPFTWKLESIVSHKHQKAAYCGIHFFDSDAYPQKYRRKLFMGNIHGGCINVDRIESQGASYRGFGEPDFLTANDSWFMPVVQKTGPDGSLYVLDWYDRYHCYQDANRDPAGIDRLKGRLYRVRYQGTPRTPVGFDLAKESDEQLIGRLAAANDFVRDSARRLLQERNTESIAQQLLDRMKLSGNEDSDPTFRKRLFITWCGLSVPDRMKARHNRDLTGKDSDVGSWQIRSLGDHPNEASSLTDLRSVWSSPLSSSEQLQAVIAAAKLHRANPNRAGNDVRTLFEIFIDALANGKIDPTLPRIVWQNLSPHLEAHSDTFVDLIDNPKTRDNAALMTIMPRLVDRLLGRKEFDPRSIARVNSLLLDWQPAVAARALGQIAAKVQNREISVENIAALKREMTSRLNALLGATPDSPAYLPAAFLATSWNDPQGTMAVRKVFASNDFSPETRLSALDALVAATDEGLIEAVGQSLDSPSTTSGLKSQILVSVSKLNDPKVADIILARYARLDADLQPKAIELLTQRTIWAKRLLIEIGQKTIPATSINVNQARRLIELKDDDLSKLLAANWGQVRTGRDPDRERYISEMRRMIRGTPGDPFAGEKAFKKVCGQCHKIYGEGSDVGPDITLNGRSDFNQLLSNVFDPSLVIGAGYRSYTVITQQGRVLNGLLAEDSPQRIVLKVQGGKQEVIARADVDEFKVNEISLMPEQLEKQLTPQEIVDLFAFISLDKHPSDKAARKLAGSSQVTPRESTNPKEYGELVREILPGFTTAASGELGVALLKDHFEREGVLRTHPVSAETPCILKGKLSIPSGKKTTLEVDVSHDRQGDWQLIVRVNGKQKLKQEVSSKTCRNGWATFRVDLTEFAGHEVTLELENAATGWSWEYGYWGGIRLLNDPQ